MKNVLFSILAGSVIVTGANCEKVDTRCAEKIGGWYLGGGLQYTHVDNDVQYASVYDDDALITTTKANKKSAQLGGSLVAGYGTLISGNLYFGGELLLDIAKNTSGIAPYIIQISDDDDKEARPNMKIKGTVPSFSVRAGYFIPSIKSLFYVKAGYACVRTEYRPDTNLYVAEAKKMSKMPLLLGVGIEKQYQNFKFRTEYEYKCRVKKTGVTVREMDGDSDTYTNRHRGWTVRTMLVYSF